MDSISDTALGQQSSWSMTFIGGTADLEEQYTLSDDVGTAKASSEVQLPLSMTVAGDRVWVVQIKGNHRMIRRLTDLGITQGSEITVVSRAGSGSVIVALQGCRIGIGAGMAHRVMVATTQQHPAKETSTHNAKANATGEHTMTAIALNLGSLEVGQSGRISGYEPGSRAYRSKLLSMGLTPGTHFTMTRQAPLGDPVEIEVRGFKLSLRKREAEALRVEMIGD